MASLLAARCQHSAAAFRLHAGAEPVGLGAAAAPRLIRTLWQSNPPLYYATAWSSVSRAMRTAPQPLWRLIWNFLVYATLAHRVKKGGNRALRCFESIRVENFADFGRHASLRERLLEKGKGFVQTVIPD